MKTKFSYEKVLEPLSPLHFRTFGIGETWSIG